MHRLQPKAWRGLATAAVLILGALAFLTSWAVSSPIGSAVDDDFHLASIWCPDGGTAECPTRQLDGRRPEMKVPANLVESAFCTFGQFDNSGACTMETSPDPTWTARFNRGQYLDIFYRVLHPLAGQPGFSSVATIRVANGVLGLVAIGLAAWALPRSGRRLLALATLPVAAPYIIQLVVSANPSSWAFTGLVAAWFGGYAAVNATRRSRRVVGVVAGVLGAAMAVLARGDAAGYVGALAVAFLLLNAKPFYRTRWFRLTLAGVGVVVVGAGTAFIAAGNTSLLKSGFGGTADVPVSSMPEGLLILTQNVLNLPLILTEHSVFNLEGVTPPLVSVIPVMAVGALTLLGLRHMTAMKTVVAVGIFTLLAGLPLFVEQMGGNTIPGPVQSRYVLPLLPVLLAVVLWRPRSGGAPTLSRAQAWAVTLGLVLSHTVALHTYIRRWVTGLDVFELNLNRGAEWWHAGPSPLATWIIGSIGFAVVASSIVWLRRDTDGDDVVPAGDTPTIGANSAPTTPSA